MAGCSGRHLSGQGEELQTERCLRRSGDRTGGGLFPAGGCICSATRQHAGEMSANWLYYPIVFVLVALSFGARSLWPAFEFAQQARFLFPPGCSSPRRSQMSFPCADPGVFTGFVWDARHLPYKVGEGSRRDDDRGCRGITSLRKHPEIGGSLPLGYTIFLFGALGTLMQGGAASFSNAALGIAGADVGVAIMVWLL